MDQHEIEDPKYITPQEMQTKIDQNYRGKWIIVRAPNNQVYYTFDLFDNIRIRKLNSEALPHFQYENFSNNKFLELARAGRDRGFEYEITERDCTGAEFLELYEQAWQNHLNMVKSFMLIKAEDPEVLRILMLENRDELLLQYRMMRSALHFYADFDKNTKDGLYQYKDSQSGKTEPDKGKYARTLLSNMGELASM